MKLKVIATGSRGNCYKLESEDEWLMLDCGVQINRIISEFRGFKGLDGVLLTHEHMDHAKAAKDLAKKGVSIYATQPTLDVLGIKGHRGKAVRIGVPCFIGRFTIIPVKTRHDAAEPCGFLIRDSKTMETALYITDTFYLPNRYPDVDYWIVECNYIDDRLDAMCEEGIVPLSMRLRLKQSHMSLQRLQDALAANDLRATEKIILVHLSDSRSDEERMVEEIHTQTGVETIAALGGMEINLNPF